MCNSIQMLFQVYISTSLQMGKKPRALKRIVMASNLIRLISLKNDINVLVINIYIWRSFSRCITANRVVLLTLGSVEKQDKTESIALRFTAYTYKYPG